MPSRLRTFPFYNAIKEQAVDHLARLRQHREATVKTINQMDHDAQDAR